MSNSALKLLAASGAKGSPATYADDVFSTFLYTGTGVNQTITNGIDLSGEGGLVWIKDRSLTTSTSNNVLTDTEQGATKYLVANDTSSVTENSTTLTSFNNNGFSVGVSSSFNRSNSDIVSWSFRKAPGFFDVVTYTGNGTAGRTISHNLGSVPGMIIVRRTNAAEDWTCYHRATDSSSPQNYYLNLNTDHARDTLTGAWNNTAPTSTVFTVGNHNRVNGNGDTYVAYLFAHDAQEFGTDSDESIIKCGSYTGNGDSGVVEIDLGFEPQWVLIKSTSGSGSGANWHIIDTMRGIPANFTSSLSGKAYYLRANTNDAEDNSSYYGWIRNNGFAAYESNISNSGTEYIYVAIRRPHKPASEFAATDLFTPVSQNFAPGIMPAGFPIDFIWHAQQGSSNYKRIFDRLRGATKGFYTDQTNADVTHNLFALDNMTGFEILPGTTIDLWSWLMFRRAPGFMDIVAYEGTGSATTFTHNLGVTPEMIILKNRNDASSFQVYHSANDAIYHLELNNTNARNSNSAVFNATAPTSSVFSVGFQNNVNGSGKSLMAYLFASVSGISKVGSSTGTGSDVNVDCGFSSGARLVIIKRSDSTGGWYLWDSARGIVAGNDGYFLMNDNAAPVTNTDYIDPLASGFTVTSSAPAALNASGGTYLFYAIA